MFQISLYTFAFGLQVLTLENFLFFSAAYIYYYKMIRIKGLLVFTFSLLYFILLLLLFFILHVPIIFQSVIIKLSVTLNEFWFSLFLVLKDIFKLLVYVTAYVCYLSKFHQSSFLSFFSESLLLAFSDPLFVWLVL